MNASRFCAVAVVFAAVAIACGPAFADPLPGEVLKFYQTPLNNGLAVYPPGAFPSPGDIAAPFPGHDEWSTATQVAPGQYQGQYMADDFSDNFNSSIAHVMWWGSYQNNLRDGGAQKFLITFETDVAAGAPGNQFPYSHPGSVISSQIVTLGPLAQHSGTFTESLVAPGPLGPPSPDGALYQYNAELALPAPEAAGVVEWIKIVALKDNPSEPWVWGWHDRDYGIRDPLASPVPVPGEFAFPTGLPFPNPGWHFQDDAVTGPIMIFAGGGNISVLQQDYAPTSYIPQYDGIGTSKDLAFALYTVVPEPSTVMLLSMGSLGVIVTALRRRRSC